MRFRKSTFCQVVCLIYLCCLVQQCHLLALLTNAMGNAVGSAVTMSTAVGMTVMQSMAQGIISTIGHAFSTLHTMALSLFSGFIMGNLALASFILFLLVVVPAEERRSLGGTSVFSPRHISYYHNYTDYRGIPLRISHTNSSSLSRTKRDVLVNNTTYDNATAILTVNSTVSSLTVKSTGTPSPIIGDNVTIPVHLLEDSLHLNDSDRIPRFLTRLVQRDPLNCLPLLLCGLSASRKPSERTEVLNDYAYLLKEFLRPDLESPEDKSSEEDDRGKKKKGGKDEKLRSSLQLLTQLVQGGMKDKKKDEVDKLIDHMRDEEEEKLEDDVLTEMAQDPSDLKFALDDMKVRGLKKTMSKMNKNSKKKYLVKLMGDDSMEDEEGELIDDDEDPDIPKALMGRYERPGPSNEESGSMEDPYGMYDTRYLTRGAYPQAPPVPPVPSYGSYDNELYKRNLALLAHNLNHEIPRGFTGRRVVPMMGSHHPYPQGRRRSKDVKHVAPQRAFLQKKRGEAEQADNVYDKSRVAAELGAVTRSNRQCRTLFNECPVTSITRPIVSGGSESETENQTPFISRAVNNIRRVLLGSPSGGSSKTRRVNEIKEVIQQLQPVAPHHGSSEVKVVLNIGPSQPPQIISNQELHRTGGVPAAAHTFYEKNPPPHYPPDRIPMYPSPVQNSMPLNMPMSSSSLPAPPPTGFGTQLKYVLPNKPEVKPSTTPKPATGTTKKTLTYRKPASTPESKKARPTESTSVVFDDLEQLLKTTLPPDYEEEVTTDIPGQPTVNTFTDIVASMEQDEPSVESDFPLPTKYPMTKDEYANGLRETFKLFDKFKKAHKTPVLVTIARSTDKPKTNGIVGSTTRKPAGPQKKGDVNKQQANKVKKPGLKGEQADLELEEHPEKDQDDLSSVWNWFQNWRKRRNKNKHKKGKGKGKKGKGKEKPDDSSEESSEEHHYPKRKPIVAVPPPYAQKIHWRSGTTLVKDGVYHLFFGNRETKPLPPPLHYHHESDEDDDHPKPIRHDVHYYEHPHHDLPNHDLPEPDHSVEKDHGPSYYHRLRTSESVEEDIPPPPPRLHDQPGIVKGKKKSTKKKVEVTTPLPSPVPVVKTTSSPKVVTPKSTKVKLNVLRPITRPDPEPSSYEDDHEEDDDNDYRSRVRAPPPRLPPLPPRRRQGWDSGSIENSYEEEEEEEADNGFEGRPAQPHMLFSPFSLVHDGDKVKLKSKGPIINGSSKKTVKKTKGGGGTGNQPTAKGTKTKGTVTKTGVSSTTTTVKPKRKILKYKNG